MQVPAEFKVTVRPDTEHCEAVELLKEIGSPEIPPVAEIEKGPLPATLFSNNPKVIDCEALPTSMLTAPDPVSVV